MTPVTPKDLELYRMAHPQPITFPFVDIVALIAAIQKEKKS